MLDDLVALLDRQVRFLLEKKGAAFFRQLSQFVKFIHEEPRLAVCLEDMRKDATEARHLYLKHDEAFVPQLVELRRELVKLGPGVDDSTMTPEEGYNDPHRWGASLAKFDLITAGKIALSWEVDTTKDTTRSGKLFGIIETKIGQLQQRNDASRQAPTAETTARSAALADFERRVSNLRARHVYEYRQIVERKLLATGLLLDGIV
jgi:hypothetical protein